LIASSTALATSWQAEGRSLEMTKRLKPESPLSRLLSTSAWRSRRVLLGISSVSVLNQLGYRTGNGNTWTEKRVQHVRHTNGFPACPPPDQRLWITMQQAAAALGVSEMVVRRLIAQKSLPAKRIVKFTPWMIERLHLELPAVRKAIRIVHTGRRSPSIASNDAQGPLFIDIGEV
jgi:hypothetical protein